METKIKDPVEIAMRETETTQALCETYDNYIIDSPDAYQASAEDLKSIKAKIKELTETRFSLTRPLEESKKKIIALFKVPLDFLARAEAKVKKGITGWHQQQEEIRLAEEQRLAEMQRQEAEKLRKQAEKEAVKAEALKTEKGRAEAKAKAEKLQAEAVATTAMTPTVESKVEDISGISKRRDWKFEIIDASQIPREYMIPDEKYIGLIVRASKGKKEIPGVKIFYEDNISSRSS